MTTADLCRTLRVSRGRQLNNTSLHILAFLIERGGTARITDIVAELDVSSITGSMKQLEKLGDAYRHGAEHDQRAVYATITEKGRAEVARCLKPASV